MKIVLTEFARKRHTPTSGRSYFKHSENELLLAVHGNWSLRKPGIGRDSLTEVVIIPLNANRFCCNTVEVTPHTRLIAYVDRRQDNEEPFIKVAAEYDTPTVRPTNAYVVCYHSSLLKDEEKEGVVADWYIVAIGASDVSNEPMHPTTMMRNQLGLPGGTKVEYTSDEWVRAVHYWSMRTTREVVSDENPV